MKHKKCPVGYEKMKCDVCGRFISLIDFENGSATSKCISVDSHYSVEEYEVLCKKHVNKK
jgi:hypothetical protein